jgi:hypothetical protein
LLVIYIKYMRIVMNKSSLAVIDASVAIYSVINTPMGEPP